MRVRPQEQRPGDLLLEPVFADGLGDGEDVVLVEGDVEGGAPVPRGAEGDALAGNRHVGV